MSKTPNDSMEEPKIKLKEGLNIKDLMKDGATFEVNFDHQEEREQLAYKPEDAYMYGNPACLDITDEETYQDDQPFVSLAKLMKNVTPDGKIMKRIIREGYGDVIPHMATVTVEYNAYLEYNDEPFDSTYIRKRPFRFRLNSGETLVGLDVAVQSMKINEKSQFLVDPEFAYGSLGCLERVPANSTCLFEIEVKNVVDSGATYTYSNLTESQQNEFDEIYKYANALCMKAKDLCIKGAWKAAAKEYNIAVSKLQNCNLRDIKDQEKQQNLLLRLYTNLAVVYTKLQEPRRGCANCNYAFNLCKGTSLKPSAKLYFNNARCLMLLGDFEHAERQLKRAKHLEPLNVEISNELKKLEEKKIQDYKKDVAVAKAYFNPKNENGETGITAEFKETMRQFCEDLLKDAEAKEYIIPNDLSDAERIFTNTEVKKHGLNLKCSNIAGVTKLCIVKPTDLPLQNKINQLTIK